jgi:hypothetical protein
MVVIATLRAEERARLRSVGGELARETRLLLEQAENTTIELAATSEDPDEQAAARAAYPDADLSTTGLAEQLAGAPALLQQYRDARSNDPIVLEVQSQLAVTPREAEAGGLLRRRSSSHGPGHRRPATQVARPGGPGTGSSSGCPNRWQFRLLDSTVH